MKQTVDILPGHSTTFNAGQSGKYLIIREASQSIILKGDALRPVELERGDTVDVSRFDELEIYNHNTTSVHVEFQVSDVEVRIRTASTAINGALNINEVQTPIVVSRIQEPLDVQVHIPDVAVNIPDVKATIADDISISNFPDVQKVEVTNSVQASASEVHALAAIVIDGQKSIPANIKRKGLIVIAPKTNADTVMIAGFIPLEAGGCTTIPATNALSVTGADGDMVSVGEVR